MLIFPLIHTERLKLRKLQVEDFPSLVKYANNKAVGDNIVNIPYPFREPDAAFRLSSVSQGFKNRNRFCFAIELKERNEIIGEITINLMDSKNNHAQLAYWVGEPFWKNGYATEAAKAIINFGFEKLNQELIYADAYSENIGSQKVMTKNGMKKHTENGNIYLYKITKEEFQSLNG